VETLLLKTKQMKTCSKCKIEKPLTEFHKKKAGKYGVRAVCKLCAKAYYKANKDKLKAYSKAYQEANKDKVRVWYEANKDKIKERKKAYDKAYREANKDKIKAYREANKDKIKEQIKAYHEANKQKIRLYQKEWTIKKKKEDPLFKLQKNIRSLILDKIKKKGYTKKSKTYQILGCTYEEFKEHIERQFTKGMTWENYGEWHLDHIYPVS